MTLDLSPARIARAEALLAVETGTDEDWKREAKAALWEAIKSRDTLTTDDIACPQPREPRAWGPIMLAAQRAGFIENTHTTRCSTSATCHARPKTVWRVNRQAVAGRLSATGV